MTWYFVTNLEIIQEQGRQVFQIESHKVLMIWHDNQVHAVQAQCPHLKLPLEKAKINEANEIVCPFHKSAFDLCSGEVKCWSPWPALLSGVLGKVSKPKNLIVYPVKLEDNRIFIEITS